MQWLLDPFTPDYMQRALLEIALVAVAGGALGAFVVLRRLAFATHALGVGTFPGVVVASALGVSAFAGGLVAALSLAAVLALLARRRDVDLASATGLVLAAALSLGGLLVSSTLPSGEEVDRLLFGSLLGITSGDVARSAAVAGLALVSLGLFGRGWLAVAFDRQGARALGLRPTSLDLALLVALTLTVVATVDAVGSLLASSLLLVPAASARLVVHRLLPLVATSMLIGVAAGVGGLMLGFHLNAPPSATVALLSAVIFVGVQATRTLRAARADRLVLVTAVSLALLAACGGSGERAAPADASGAAPSDAVTVVGVVATTPLVAEWARIVGGDHVSVSQILEPNVDAHDFEPTPDDASAVAEADVVLASGGGFDEWMDGLVANAGPGVPFVEVAPEADLRPRALEGEPDEGEEHTDDDDHGNLDPHFWHDPTLAAKAVSAIAEALAAAAGPAARSAIEGRARDYLAELAALDVELAGAFGAVPVERRKLVTDHDAFGYLARRYEIEVVGAAIPSASTAAEPSAAEIAELIETIRAERVVAIFSERTVDPKLIEQIADEAGASVVPDLYGDSPGGPGSGVETYVEMMRHNARVLVQGFTGT